MRLTALCLDWHLKDSDAFRDILVTPLKPYIDIELTVWDGARVPTKFLKSNHLIFCMLPPPEHLLAKPDFRATWIPMWDQAQGYDDAWWSALPKGLRIVAFSQRVYEKATSHGLSVIRVKYYKDPEFMTRSTWEQGNVMFYWNRVGMVAPIFIESLCKALQVNTLLFKPDIDPRIEQNKYFDLPRKLGDTNVKVVRPTKTRSEFLKKIEDANIVLAPRLTEGVGMVYLEAMSRGMAVIAHNAPTMNEYIQSGRNGILVDGNYISFGDRLQRMLGKVSDYTAAPFLLTDHQPWGSMTKMQPKKLGDQALADCRAGFSQWLASQEAYARFLLD